MYEKNRNKYFPVAIEVQLVMTLQGLSSWFERVISKGACL